MPPTGDRTVTGFNTLSVRPHREYRGQAVCRQGAFPHSLRQVRSEILNQPLGFAAQISIKSQLLRDEYRIQQVTKGEAIR